MTSRGSALLVYFILGIALLTGFLLAARWFVSTDPKMLATVLKRVLVGLALAVAVFMIVTGRFTWALFTLPVILPWIMRFRSLARMAKNFRRMSQGMGGTTGRTSDIETRFLALSLNHDSGALSGEVREGTYAGRRIEDLKVSELVDLLRVCAAEDPQSAQVLEAYLNRVHPDWHDQAGGQAQSGDSFGRGAMDREEAYRILGLEAGATSDAIKEAHHRLMAGMHPDHGGSTYLAAKLNQAKDVLLRN